MTVTIRITSMDYQARHHQQAHPGKIHVEDAPVDSELSDVNDS